MKPREFINFIQENSNNNGTLKSSFVLHYLGKFSDQELGGIIEIKHEKSFTHIQSLVVHPKFFRKGIAKKLMAFVLSSFHNKPMVVETGVKNIPAIKLYKKFKFIEVNQWETNHGVRKIKFLRNTNNELNKRS